MIQSYVELHALDKESEEEGAPMLRGGLVRLDPHLYAILSPKPPPMTDSIRKDAIFKSIGSCTNPAYVVSQIDPNQLQSAQAAASFTLQSRTSNTFHGGPVPKV